MTKTKEEIIATIKKEIPFVDIKPYSHNIISLQLTMLEEVAGEEAVVELVKSTKLKDLGWGYMINETTIVENINCKKCDNTLPPHTIKEHMDISNSIHNCPHKEY